MTTMLFTPIMMSAVRNGVPLPDMDGDVEQWAMSAHAKKYDCVKMATCNYGKTDTCLVDCGCPYYVSEQDQYEKAKKELADAMDAIDAEIPDGPYIEIEGLGVFIEEEPLPAWLMAL